MKPEVTVLMSVYNGLPYLAEAVESILNQSYAAFEFLIIDDASADGSAEMLAAYARRDPRVRVLTNPANGGLGYSLAKGVEAARTPWIARMDADDVALPERLEVQLRYLQEHPETDVLGSWAHDVDSRGQRTHPRTMPSTHRDIVRYIWTNPLVHSTVVFRRDAVVRAGSYRPIRCGPEDYDLWFRCAAHGLRFANVPEVLLHYRCTSAQMKRSARFLRTHLRVGWRGCWALKRGPAAYLGVAVPAVKLLLPKRLERLGHRTLKRFDPRVRRG